MPEPDRIAHTSAADFIRSATDLAARHPDATELVLHNGSGQMREVARMAALRPYRDLALRDTTLSEDDAAGLAGSPWLDHLDTLDLRDTGLTDGCLRALLGGTAYRRLRLLDLSDSGRAQWFTIDGLSSLPHAGFAATLEHLDVGGRRLSDSVLDIVATLPRLTGLGLRNSCLTESGLTALLRLPMVARLEMLDVSVNALGDAAVVALAAADWPRLRSLNLAGTGAGHAATVALANAASLAELGALNLGNNRLSDAGALMLASSPQLGQLRWLTVNAAALGDAAIEALQSRFGAGLVLEYPWT
jgi:hypothetical protein